MKRNEDQSTDMPAIVLRPISSLIRYAKNARTHSPEQVREIAASIREFGWVGSVLADADGLVAGHGRLMALELLISQGEAVRFPGGGILPPGVVPVVACDGWSPKQRKAYIIADNKLALNAGWDNALLKSELSELKLEGFDLTLAGFRLEELDELLGKDDDGSKDPDAVPDPPPVPISKPGDVWILGPHRVVCGDSTTMESLLALTRGELVDAIWTDPPYNVAYEGRAGKIENDSMSDGKFREFLRDAFTGAFAVSKPGAAIYVAHSDTEGYNFRSAFRDAGFKLSGVLVWKKDSLVLGRSDYQWIHEPILYGWKPGSKHRWYGGRKNVTVQDLGEKSPFVQDADGSWVVSAGGRLLRVSGDARVEEMVPSIIEEKKPKRSDVHPTMKPVELVERMLKHSARPGDVVLDLFGGSGTTLIAAERLGMCARLVEFDPKFVDVIVARWEEYTGRKAELETKVVD